ncbi:FAD binding domain-containing protein [Aquamicrobium terrae]|uniref:Carbon-monoxide dehydrogenase medium subunit n=1 Tax=Aquamicrobium terrae TaxID=1324945 RepID=A0ABV2N6S3_9HYPH
MKPPSFSYLRPASLEEAVVALCESGDDAMVLAGGQSLLPAMVLRVARPSVLVDISSLRELRQVEIDDQCITIGAAVTHNEILHSDELASAMPVLRTAAGWIAHYSIREKGTFGGSLANADPASEWPCIAICIGATVHVAGREGSKAVKAEEFFLGPLTSALEPGEIITHVTIPRLDDGEIVVFDELAAQHGAFGYVLVAIKARLVRNRIKDIRICVGGCGGVPELAMSHAEEFQEAELNEQLAVQMAEVTVKRLEPDGDRYIASDDRRQMAAELIRRNLLELGAKLGQGKLGA